MPLLPFSAGVTSLLYIDRRMRREGLDLELTRAAGATRPGGEVAGQGDARSPDVQRW